MVLVSVTTFLRCAYRKREPHVVWSQLWRRYQCGMGRGSHRWHARLRHSGCVSARVRVVFIELTWLAGVTIELFVFCLPAKDPLMQSLSPSTTNRGGCMRSTCPCNDEPSFLQLPQKLGVRSSNHQRSTRSSYVCVPRFLSRDLSALFSVGFCSGWIQPDHQRPEVSTGSAARALTD